jgi:hypothetical protein
MERTVSSLAAATVEVGVGYERKKKRLQRREKGWKEKRERVAVASLPLVRSWVDGNDGGKAGCGGGGGRCLRWRLQQWRTVLVTVGRRDVSQWRVSQWRERRSRWLLYHW